jgi:HAD superfamily hydrolase (TIGR01549 family)
MLKIKLAIFDMDGTVFESHLEWLKIREELKIPAGGDILAEIYCGGGVDTKRLEILEGYERENTLNTQPIAGVADFLLYLYECRVITVLLTNNNRENTEYLLRKFSLSFDHVITREMKLWKPEPKAFFYLMDYYGCNVGEMISIGDSHYDLKASQQAGVPRIYLIENPHTLQLQGPDVTLFRDYIQLKNLLCEEKLFRDMSTCRPENEN